VKIEAVLTFPFADIKHSRPRGCGNEAEFALALTQPNLGLSLEIVGVLENPPNLKGGGSECNRV
jgi:hypothetical protein